MIVRRLRADALGDLVGRLGEVRRGKADRGVGPCLVVASDRVVDDHAGHLAQPIVLRHAGGHVLLAAARDVRQGLPVIVDEVIHEPTRVG